MIISIYFLDKISSAVQTDCDARLLTVPSFSGQRYKARFLPQSLEKTVLLSFKKSQNDFVDFFVGKKKPHMMSNNSKAVKFSCVVAIAPFNSNRKKTNNQKHPILLELHNKTLNF